MLHGLHEKETKLTFPIHIEAAELFATMFWEGYRDILINIFF